MPFAAIHAEYARQYQEHQKAYNAHTQTPEFVAWAHSRHGDANRPAMPKFTGHTIDYGLIEEMLVAACVQDGFTVQQAQYIVGHMSNEHHSAFSDVISYTQDMCYFLKKFPK